MLHCNKIHWVGENLVSVGLMCQWLWQLKETLMVDGCEHHRLKGQCFCVQLIDGLEGAVSNCLCSVDDCGVILEVCGDR